MTILKTLSTLLANLNVQNDKKGCQAKKEQLDSHFTTATA